VDIPNGGSALISGNTFEKGPRSSNKRTAIAIGAEKETNPAGDIVVEDNSFSNDTGGATVFVQNYTARPVALAKNRLTGNVIPLNPAQPSQQDRTAP